MSPVRAAGQAEIKGDGMTCHTRNYTWPLARVPYKM